MDRESPLGGKVSPTARTLDLLRKSGYLAAVTERWVPGANIRRDLFGCFDVLAIHPVRREVVLVQTTTAGNLSSRVAKVKASPNTPAILAAGVIVQVHGWKLLDGRWQAKIVGIRAEDLEAVVVCPLPRRGRRLQQGSLFGE